MASMQEESRAVEPGEESAPGGIRQLLSSLSISPGAVVVAVAPILLYFVVNKIFGYSQQVSLSCGVVVAASSALWRMIRQKSANQVELFVLLMLVVGLVSSYVTKQPRAILVVESLQGVLGACFVFASSFTREPIVTSLLKPFFTKGDPGWEEAWQSCRDSDPPFRKRLVQLNLVWATVVLAWSTTSLAMSLLLPVDYAVALGPVPFISFSLAGFLLVRQLSKPLRGALAECRTRQRNMEPAAEEQL